MSDDVLSRLGDLVHIGTTEAALADALHRLAENYRSHGWTGEVPTYAFALAPDEMLAERVLSTDYLLYQLAHMDMTLSLDIVPSSVPLIGPLIDALRRPLHQLALFYVNKIAAQSATANLLQASLVRQLLRELRENQSDREEQDA